MLNEMPEIEVVLLQINYLDWESEIVQSRKCYEICRKYNKEIMVMEPLKGGTLVNLSEDTQKLLKISRPDDSVASWALRFAAQLDDVEVVLSGMNSIRDVKDNIKTIENLNPLTEKEYETIKNVVGIIKGIDIIPCTSCNYCAGECPNDIDIPLFFELYNEYSRSRNKNLNYFKEKYNSYSLKTQTPLDCTFCQNCIDSCPQEIDIPGYMEKLTDCFQ